MNQLRENMLKGEKLFSPFAKKSINATKINLEEEDFRPPFFRDTDRIIHTSSYTRYADKTQVFSNISNDHISKRFIHVQLVSKIARTIGRALNLNEDLIEAIALGHDLGHVPFGHVGEKILNDISENNNQGYFLHNVQSVRELMILENNGKGLNISIEVLDGILCHNGEFLQENYYPKIKDKQDFFNDYENCYNKKDYYKKLIPMTLEGCVVRISDVIAYIGRDLEDAIELGVISKEDLPDSITKVLGDNNSKIINTIVMDIINNSLAKPYITMSKDIFEALNDLKEFNYSNIYFKANSKETILEYENMFKTVFDNCMYALNNNIINSLIFTNYINKMDDNYIKNNCNERIVIDYIAGMTDDYFINEYNNIMKK